MHILYTLDFPGYKAIAVKKDLTNGAFKDPRFTPIPNLPPNEFILQLSPSFSKTNDIKTVAGQLAKMPGVYVHQYYDAAGFKGIALRTDENNVILKDPRFVKYNELGTNAEEDKVMGHVSQVMKWNQTMPDGIKRTVPSSNNTNVTSNTISTPSSSS